MTGSPSLFRLFRALRQPDRPAHDVVLQLVVGHVGLAALQAAAHRDAGAVHGLGIARHQRVPPIEILALFDKPIGAARRQPAELRDILRREPLAVVDQGLPVRIVAAAAGLAVEQAAADIRVVVLAGLLVLELVEAAAPAAVAQALPLDAGHFRQRLGLPEGLRHSVPANSEWGGANRRAGPPLSSIPSSQSPPRARGAAQSVGGGAKKQRREPSARLQRQNSPSGLGCASLNGIVSPLGGG